MNGAPGFRRTGFRWISSSTKDWRRMSLTYPSAVVRSWMFGSSPATLKSFAKNGSFPWARNDPTIDQYSSGTNAPIASSRSQISRSATVCTRPADRP